jgi:hypothetical protein
MTTKILGEQITNYTINTEQLSNTATAAFAKTLAPKILYANVASNTYSVLDDTAVNVGGGFIVITGAEFQSGATVLIDTVAASAVTFVNSNTLRAQVPARSAASYNLYVINPDGGTGLKVAGITYSGFPAWSTAGVLANGTSDVVFSTTLSANSDSTIIYSNTTSLPAGTILLANGYFYGNVSVVNTTIYSFDVKATDAENQDVSRTFSLTVNPGFFIEYLIVGGGGAGSDGGGGGGGGGVLYGSASIINGVSYPITVGSAGANSSFNTLTAFAGGNASSPGGSGGGAGYGTGNIGGLAVGSPGAGVAGTQGYPGGNGGPTSNPSTAAGGGGGAGAAGSPGTVSSVGGNGYTWPFTATTYGGGGGGAAYFGSKSGGSGGGGTSGSFPAFGNPTATAGTAGLGGGGGGGYNGGSSRGGGSGTVILAIPTPNYPGSAPGATVTTPPAAPGKTVITFTSSGSYTA